MEASPKCDLVTLDEFLDAPKEAVQGKLGLADPDRVIQVEWRYKTRPEVSWLTCHSFIEAHMKDGQRIRFQKYSNRGYSETILPMSEVSVEGLVYRNRCASVSADTLSSRPLLAADLQAVASEIGSTPYCVAHSNCHHFARELWNAVVVESMRQSSYPDRVKTNMLRGSKHLGLDSISNTIANSDMLCVDYGSDDDLETDLNAGWKLTCRQEESSRVSGEFSAPRSNRSGYNRVGRLMDFRRLLSVGTVYKIDTAGVVNESDMVALRPPEDISTGEDDECEVWAAEWLTGSGDSVPRLAERITGADLVTLLARLPEKSSTEHSDEPMLQRQSFTGSLNTMFGALSAGPQDELVQDMCFVVLQSAEELRLAVFAVLKPANQPPGRRPRRLRLLSGDAVTSDEGNFSFSMQDLPPAPLGVVTQAVDVARQEQQALKTALVTRDWAFVTLQ